MKCSLGLFCYWVKADMDPWSGSLVGGRYQLPVPHVLQVFLSSQVSCFCRNVRCAWESWAHGAEQESQGAVLAWLPYKREFFEEADQQMAPFHISAVWDDSAQDSVIWSIWFASFFFLSIFLYCFFFSGLPWWLLPSWWKVIDRGNISAAVLWVVPVQ